MKPAHTAILFMIVVSLSITSSLRTRFFSDSHDTSSSADNNGGSVVVPSWDNLKGLDTLLQRSSQQQDSTWGIKDKIQNIWQNFESHSAKTDWTGSSKDSTDTTDASQNSKQGDQSSTDKSATDKQTTPPREQDSTAPANSDNSDNAGQNSVLDLHNEYRSRHGVPALSWSSSIASSAQAYAQRCIFQHSGANGLGENLATGYKDWATVIKVWYDEEGSYDYNAGQFSHETGHFTQMVWKATTQLGCGYAPCSGQPMYVCQYSPPGNVIGEFKENVPRKVAA